MSLGYNWYPQVRRSWSFQAGRFPSQSLGTGFEVEKNSQPKTKGVDHDKTCYRPDIVAAKGKRKLTEMTAYDYPTALWVDQSGIDMILVGDSLAMVVLGHEDTLSITMDEMIHHTRAVARTAKHALVIGDLPFLSYQVSVEQAVLNAGRLIKEARAQAVKLEGGRRVVPQIQAIVDAQIPVQGHLGLTPQSSAAFGGFKVQGKTAEAARELIEDAQALTEAGCFSIVLEGIPSPIAAMVTEAIPIPTIGIGAGPRLRWTGPRHS